MAQWTVPIDKLIDAAQGRAELVCRKIAFDVFSAVVERSPVDIGRFRANWLVGVNERPRGANAELLDAGASDAQVRKALDFKIGDTLWLANNLPYAVRLEEGWSKQAPAGMVALTVNEFALYVRSASEAL